MQKEYPVLVSCKPLRAEFSGFKKINITSDNDFSLGRALHNSLVLPSIVISRSHCKFRKENDKWLIEDYSSCGIEVNGVRLGKGNTKNIFNDDIIGLDPLQEFVYKFIWPNDHTECKRIKLENDRPSCIFEDVKTKFEESQNIAMLHIEDKIQKQKQLQVANQLLRDELYEKTNIKVEQLEKSFGLQIDNLKGEKEEVQRQKILLIEERDAQISKLKKEMDSKINELMDQIKKHNEKESELVNENNSLKQKLLKEREEFLAELDKENMSKHDLLDKLHKKIKEQEEMRLREKQQLEKMLELETEKLRLAKDKELHALSELNKQRELELLEEHKKIKQGLEKEIEDMRKESKIANSQVLNNKMMNRMIGEAENLSMAGPSNESEKPLEQIGQMMESELQCSICAEIFINPIMLNCGHTFCKYCINLWKKKKKDCPICRTTIKHESKSIVVESFIEKILPNLSQEMKKKREESLKNREEDEIKASSEAILENIRGATAESESESESQSDGGEEQSSGGAWQPNFDHSYILDTTYEYNSSGSDSDSRPDFYPEYDIYDYFSTGSSSDR